MKKKEDKIPTQRRAYKFRLRVTPHQAKALRTFMMGTNLVYNLALAEQIRVYEVYKKYVEEHGEAKAKEDKIPKMHSQFTLVKFYKIWRDAQTEHGELLRAVPAAILVQKIMDLNRAYLNFFRKNALFPTFKKDLESAFRVQQCENGISTQPELIKLSPTHSDQLGHVSVPLLGHLSFYWSRPIYGDIKNYTISARNGKYYIAIQTEYPDDAEKNIDRPVGIDFGLKPFISTSNGDTFYSPNYYEQQLNKIAIFQEDLKKSSRGSARYEKKRLRLERLHVEIQNKRHDWLHKLSTDLAREYNFIAIPDIKITTWDKSKKLQKRKEAEDQEVLPAYTKEEYRDIRRQLRDCSWEFFVNILTYKVHERGGLVVKVPIETDTQEGKFPYFTSNIEQAKIILENAKKALDFV